MADLLAGCGPSTASPCRFNQKPYRLQLLNQNALQVPSSPFQSHSFPSWKGAPALKNQKTFTRTQTYSWQEKHTVMILNTCLIFWLKCLCAHGKAPSSAQVGSCLLELFSCATSRSHMSLLSPWGRGPEITELVRNPSQVQSGSKRFRVEVLQSFSARAIASSSWNSS